MKYALILSSFILLSSCTTQDFNKMEFISVDEHIIDYKYNIAPVSAHSYYEDDSLHIIFAERNSNELVRYNIDSKSFDNIIPINYRDDQFLYSFVPVDSKDSIFLLFNAAKNYKYRHDSTLLLIDNLGNIKRAIDLSGLPISESKRDSINKDSLCFIDMTMSNLEYDNENVFLPLSRYRYSPGDYEYDNPSMPIASHVDIGESDKKVIYPIKFPLVPQGHSNRYMPFSAVEPRITLDFNGKPIIHFGHTSKMYRYNFITDRIDSIMVSSVLYNGKVPIRLFESNQIQWDYKSMSYTYIYRNAFDKTFFRLFRIPQEDKSKNDKNEQRFGVIMFDSTYHILGEGVIPEGFSDRFMFYDSSGVWLWNKEKSMETKNIVINKFKLKLSNTSPEKYRKYVNRQNGVRKVTITHSQ